MYGILMHVKEQRRFYFDRSAFFVLIKEFYRHKNKTDCSLRIDFHEISINFILVCNGTAL